MEPAHSETGDCKVEPPASILVARLSMSHLVPLLEFNRDEQTSGMNTLSFEQLDFVSIAPVDLERLRLSGYACKVHQLSDVAMRKLRI
jgi:hypothetical protein